LRAGASDFVSELGNRLREQILQLPVASETSFDRRRVDRERIPFYPRNLNIDRNIILTEFFGFPRCRHGREGGRYVVEQIRQLRKHLNQSSGHFRQVALGRPEAVASKLKRKIQRPSMLIFEFREDHGNLLL